VVASTCQCTHFGYSKYDVIGVVIIYSEELDKWGLLPLHHSSMYFKEILSQHFAGY
jgi:hypothetical protein